MEKQSIRDLIYRKLTSRKFHVALIGYVSATLFFYWGLLPPELWVDFIKWTFGIYAISNIGEHVTRSVENSGRGPVKPPNPK